MNYQDLIDKALQGRSVYKLAKALELNQVTLNRYVKGDRLPDFGTALLLAKEANVTPGEVLVILAEEERRKREMKELLSQGFRLLTNALNRLFTRVSAA